MKKIKFLLMLLLGVVMSVSFVSCGDDDDDDKDSGLYAGSPIVGSWTWTWSEDKSDRGSMTSHSMLMELSLGLMKILKGLKWKRVLSNMTKIVAHLYWLQQMRPKKKI